MPLMSTTIPPQQRIEADVKAAYPDLSWAGVLSPAAIADLDHVGTECLADTIGRYRGQPTATVVLGHLASGSGPSLGFRVITVLRAPWTRAAKR